MSFFDDIIDDMPEAHRILFGFIHKDLAASLAQAPHAVHVQDAQGRTALWWACFLGARDEAQMLLDYGACINSTDQNGEPPIMAACCHTDSARQAEVVKMLLDNEPDLSIKKAYGSNMLHCAARISDYETRREVMRQSINQGADADLRTIRRAAPLAYFLVKPYCQWEDYELLLQAGADIDACEKHGVSILQAAIQRCNLEALSWLLYRGADTQHRDGEGCTILHYAASCGSSTTMQVLRTHDLSGVSVEARNDAGYTAMNLFESSRAASHYTDEVVREFYGLVADLCRKHHSRINNPSLSQCAPPVGQRLSVPLEIHQMIENDEFNEDADADAESVASSSMYESADEFVDN